MVEFKLKINNDIDYIKHSTRYNQKSTTNNITIKFRKKT